MCGNMGYLVKACTYTFNTYRVKLNRTEHFCARHLLKTPSQIAEVSGSESFTRWLAPLAALHLLQPLCPHTLAPLCPCTLI